MVRRLLNLRDKFTVFGIALVLVLALTKASPAPARDRQDPVRIGVLAKRGPERCLEKWGPTAEYLSSEVPGRSFTIVPLGFEEINPAVERGDVDFMLTNPSFYVGLEKLYGANRIATLKNRRTAGVFTVSGGVVFRRADREDIQDLDDLQGKTFMADKETSLDGWYAVWRELKERGIDPHHDFAELSFGGTHDAVVYAVRDGKVDAGTVRTDTLERMAMEGKIRLEDFHALEHDHIGEDVCEFPFLHSTDIYPEWPFAELKHTSGELAEKVAIALIGMPPDCPGAQAARCAGWTVALNYQPVHDCLKELRIGPFKDFEKITLGSVFRRYWLWLVGAAAFLVAAVIAALYVLQINRKLNRSRLDLANELTERREAEEALRESAEHHRAITESAQDAVVAADAEGNIRFWNHAAETIFGFSAAEAVDKNMMDLIVPHAYQKAKRKGLAEFARTGRGAAIGNTVELIAQRKDGAKLPIEMSLSAYKGADGFMAAALIRDITTRNRAKEELQRAHAEAKQLFEAISSVLIGVDNEDKVTAWNGAAEHTFGIKKNDAVGRSFDDLEIQWDHEVVAECVSQCRATNRATRLEEVRFKHPDGRDGFLGMTLNPLHGTSGKRGGFLLVAADITGKKILQGQLAQSQKLESIGQLAAGIAHEINTPIQYVGDNVRFLSDSIRDLLCLVGSYRDLASGGIVDAGETDGASRAAALEEEADLPYLEEEMPKALEQSLDGVERVSRIVRAMKDFSHPGSEGKESADINKAIESTITVARNEWKYVAEMVTDFDPALPLVPCLIGDFNQVILNIVINAAHAIADVVGDGGAGKGTITVSTRHDDGWAEIRISDTGTGISEAHRSKVFDHFFTTKEVGKGTGQGLAIAHAVITDKHDGTITLESEMGKGTTFIIRLPIESEAAAPVEMQSDEEVHSIR